MRSLLLAVTCALTLACAGCPQAQPCPDPETLLPMEALVESYNRNASQVPRLWARDRSA